MDEQDHGLSARRRPARPSGPRASIRATRGEEARLERLSAYLDGWVEDRDRAAVERELASDPEARGVLDDLRLVRLALGDLKAPRAPRSFALLAAPPRRDSFALFRRLEWATRGAAGVAALAFAVALVRAPQVGETVTSAAPALAQQSAPAPAAAEPPQATGARERDAQTLDAVLPTAAAGAAAVAPALAPTIPATATPAPAPSAATRGVVPAPEPAPAPPAVGAPPPAATGTPAPSAPTLLAAPSPTVTETPSVPAASAATPVATVEATRLAVAPPAAPVAKAPPPGAITPTVAPVPDIPVPKQADGTNAPAPTAAPGLAPASTLAVKPGPGTTLPAATSEEAGEADLAPALGVLAGLLTVLALVERAGARRRQG